jgi:hypothetical protein
MTTTIEFITALFCQVEDHLPGIPKHPEAHLSPRVCGRILPRGLLGRRAAINHQFAASDEGRFV